MKRLKGIFFAIYLFSVGVSASECYEFFYSMLKPARSEKDLRVAVIEFNPEHGKKTINQGRLLAAINEAADRGANLIVTPELSTTGYQFENKKLVALLSNEIPCVFTDKLKMISRERGVYLVVSFMERAGRRDGHFNYYISAVMAGPDGKLHRHRKKHLETKDCRWSTPGEKVPVFNTPYGKVAIGICRDVMYMDFVDRAAEKGAAIFISPTASMGPAVSALNEIALRYGMLVIGANRSGPEKAHSGRFTYHMIGGSRIVLPDGTVALMLPEVKRKRRVRKIRIGIADVEI